MAGVYIHIPFCRQACHYCNFYFTTSPGNKDKFIEALLREIELSKDYLEGEQIETLYFGGGTPSLLSASELGSIIKKLGDHYDLSKLKEFTLEANPDDLSAEKVTELKALQSLGLNRFSIGVQSFFDEDLKYMNRAHNSAEALSSIKRVQDAGFENITIDLIYGTPTMNDERWLENLNTAFALGVPHISSYALTVEPKTNLDKKIRKGESKPVSEEQAASQFNILMEEMKKAGYEQYEISNFAKPGKYALHNSNYWSGKKYLGLGPSAHSYNRVARKWNVANNVGYIQAIESDIIPAEEEILTKAQQINERIMTALRTMWGLNLGYFEPNVVGWIKEDLSVIDPGHYVLNGEILVLTNKGRMFADAIAASLFVTEEQFL
jgi:oxygen-independent coproporphyrinogen-3 oxidase